MKLKLFRHRSPRPSRVEPAPPSPSPWASPSPPPAESPRRMFSLQLPSFTDRKY